MQVLVVDDHPMLCDALTKHIKQVPFATPISVRPVFGLSDALEAVTSEPLPDLVFLDLGLDRQNRGATTLRHFQEGNPRKVPVVVYTGLELEEVGTIETLRECLFDREIKALGVILKKTQLDLMFIGLTRLLHGEPWMPPEVIEKLATTIQIQDPNPTGYHLGLSRREWDVALGMTRGLQDREIAREIQRSPDYVRQVAGNIYRKLNVKNRTQAAGVLISAGYTDDRRP